MEAILIIIIIIIPHCAAMQCAMSPQCTCIYVVVLLAPIDRTVATDNDLIKYLFNILITVIHFT